MLSGRKWDTRLEELRAARDGTDLWALPSLTLTQIWYAYQVGGTEELVASPHLPVIMAGVSGGMSAEHAMSRSMPAPKTFAPSKEDVSAPPPTNPKP